MSGANIYGVTTDFIKIQPAEIQYGRYISEADFDRGSNAVVMGHELAEKLFGSPERAIGKLVTVRGKTVA